VAITTYAELKTAIENYYARSDSTFTARIDEFIDLAEDRIHYGDDGPLPSEPLRLVGMETTGDLTVSSQTVAQPTGFLAARRLYLNTDPKVDLEYMAPDRFWSASANTSGTSGEPKIFTIEGTNFVFGPSPDTSYTGKLAYWKKLDALSDSATTNWLITNSPGTYLYACLLEAAIWDKSFEDAAKYMAAYAGRVNALMGQDRKHRFPGTPLAARVDWVR